MKPDRHVFRCVKLRVAYGAIILSLVVFSEHAIANLLFESPCGPNKAYKQDLLGVAKTTRNDMECSILCQINENCNSFTFNHGNGGCELSTGAQKTCSLLTSEADSIYYVVVSFASIFSFCKQYSI